MKLPMKLPLTWESILIVFNLDVLLPLLAVLSALVVVLPFTLAAAKTKKTNRSLNLAIHRRRLAELDEDLANNAISVAAYEEAKAELSAATERDVVAGLDAEASEATAETDSRWRAAWLWPVLMAVFMLLGAYLLYGAYQGQSAYELSTGGLGTGELGTGEPSASGDDHYAFLQAVEDYTQRIEPKTAFGDYVRLARRYVRLGKVEDAKRAFAAAIARLPDTLTDTDKNNLFLEAGMLHVDTARNFFDPKAQALLARSAEFDAKETLGLYTQFSRVFTEKDQLELAEDVLASANEFVPGNVPKRQLAEYYFEYAVVIATRVGSYNDQALDLLASAVETDPEYIYARIYSAITAEQRGEFATAQAHYDWLVPRAPDEATQQEMLDKANRMRQAQNIDSIRLQDLLQSYQQEQQAQRLAEQEQAAILAEEASEVMMNPCVGSDEQTTNNSQPTPAVVSSPVEGGITVTIRLADALRSRMPDDALLFVFVKAANGPPQPLAVRRFDEYSLPMTLTLSDADAMIPGMNISAFSSWEVGVNVSVNGVANLTTGDLFGRQLVDDASQTIELLIDQVAQ